MNPLLDIQTISFELSNICPHSRFHKTCPCSLQKEPSYLESDLILRTFDEMRKVGWRGSVMFSIYNEPMADPRFFWLVDELNWRVPGATLRLWASSYWMTDEMLRELASHNVRSVGVNFYGEREKKRTLHPPDFMRMEWRGGAHDNRLDLYNSPPDYRGALACGLPFREVVIWHTGKVGLCCREWARSVSFGDLHSQSLVEVLRGEDRKKFLKRTKAEGRFLDPCTKCNHELEGIDEIHY